MNRLKLHSTLLLTIFSLLFISCQGQKVTTAQTKLSTDARVDSLMKLMTLEEKIGQTVMYSGSGAVTGPTVNTNFRAFIKNAEVGAMLNVYSAKGTRNLQKLAVENTRLGIPLLFGYESR